MTCFATSADGNALTTSASSIGAAPACHVKDAEQVHLQRLMEAYQQADAEAVTELVLRLSPLLLRFLAFWFAITDSQRSQTGRKKRGKKCHAY